MKHNEGLALIRYIQPVIDLWAKESTFAGKIPM